MTMTASSASVEGYFEPIQLLGAAVWGRWYRGSCSCLDLHDWETVITANPYPVFCGVDLASAGSVASRQLDRSRVI